jgi:carbonic anhydrase
MLDHLKENNRTWAARMVSEDADFFRRLERQQAPKYLWIGCSDSRVSANTIVGLDPGQLFRPPERVDGQRRGLVDHWLHPIREVYRARCSELDAIVDPHARLDRLCEFNVIQQVRNVASDVFVLDAWGRGQKLAVHGWISFISDGLIGDLGVTISRS